MQYICFLFEDGELVSQHILNLPSYNEKGAYKPIKSQGTSFHYFEKRESLKHYNEMTSGKPKKGKKTLCFRKDDWDKDNDIIARAVTHEVEWKHPWSEAMLFEHNSVFDFYDAIGYDRKKKKYSR